MTLILVILLTLWSAFGLSAAIILRVEGRHSWAESVVAACGGPFSLYLVVTHLD